MNTKSLIIHFNDFSFEFNEWVSDWLTDMNLKYVHNHNNFFSYIFRHFPLIRSIIKHIYSDKNINRVIYNMKIDGLLFLIILVGTILSFHFSTSKIHLAVLDFHSFTPSYRENFNNHSNRENYFMYSILHLILLWLWLLIQYNR